MASSPDLARACAVLLGDAAHDLEALRHGPWRDELRRAFRRRALDTHPDRAAALGRAEAALAAEFRDLEQSYALLATYLEAPPPPPLAARGAAGGWSPASRAPGAAPGSPAERTAGPAAWQATTPAPDRAGASARARAPGAGPATDAAARAATATAGQPGADARGGGPRRPASAPAGAGGREPARGESQPPAGEMFHQGPMPRRALRFAEFLYYSGVVSWQRLIAAIAWQRQQRPRVGDLAVRHGLMTREEVDGLLGLRAGDGARFAERAVKAGVLAEWQRTFLLTRQRDLQPRIGMYFVEQGLIRRDQLEHLLHCARQMRAAVGGGPGAPGPYDRTAPGTSTGRPR